MKPLFFIFASLSAFSFSAHAASTLNCIADGVSFHIRGLTANAQADGTVKVTTLINDAQAPAITVKGDLTRFEVLAPQPKGNAGTQGTDHIFLVKSGQTYVLQTLTYCNPYYQEEKCVFEDDVINSSVDRQIWCQEAN